MSTTKQTDILDHGGINCYLIKHQSHGSQTYEKCSLTSWKIYHSINTSTVPTVTCTRTQSSPVYASEKIGLEVIETWTTSSGTVIFEYLLQATHRTRLNDAIVRVLIIVLRSSEYITSHRRKKMNMHRRKHARRYSAMELSNMNWFACEGNA